MDKAVLLWRSHNNDQVVHAPIVHVAVAVADTDETYGAQAAAEKNTFTNTSGSANNANSADNTANRAHYYWPVPVQPARFVDPGSAGSGSTGSGYSVLYRSRPLHVIFIYKNNRGHNGWRHMRAFHIPLYPDTSNIQTSLNVRVFYLYI